MPDVIYYVAVSLDGYIATPDGGVDWLSAFQTPEEDYGYAAFFDSIDALLFGSRTYEQALGFGEWPYGDKPCRVFSKRPLSVVKPAVHLTAKEPPAVLRELAAQGLKRFWLVGGGQLAASFRQYGLITEYILSVIPVLLGDGLPLFSAPGPETTLILIDTTTYPNGLVQLHYRHTSAV